MFHFWFNTFFVAVNHEEHTVTLKSPSDGCSRTPFSSARLPHSTARTVQSCDPSSRLHRGVQSSERVERRPVDRVPKSPAVRTSSGTSSTSSGGARSNAAVSLRRPSAQHRDPASARPRSVHATPTCSETTSNHAESATVGQVAKQSRDRSHASSDSASSRQWPSQEPKTGQPYGAVAQANGHSKAPQAARKNPGTESTVWRGNPGSGEGAKSHSISRSGSVKLVRGGSQKSSKSGVGASASADQVTVPPPTTGGMRKASSTTALNESPERDSASVQNGTVQRTHASTKASRGVPRYIQRELESRPSRVVAIQQAGVPNKQALGRIVNPSLKSRTEIPKSDPVSLTHYASRRNSKQDSLTDHQPGRQMSAPSGLQASPVVEVVGTASSRPSTYCTLMLPKSEIDKANKDVQHKVYSSDFKVVSLFAL